MSHHRLVVFLTVSALAWAGHGAGTNGAAFLKIPASARSAALGGAFTAVAEGAETALYNPAGLAGMDRPELAATHNQWIEGSRHNALAAASPAWGGVFSLSVVTFQVDGIERRSADTTAEGTFGASDAAYGLSYGRPLGERWSAGAGVSYVRQTLDGRSAGAPALSLGGLWRSPWEPLTLGAAVRHLGGSLTFDEEGDPLPLTLALGAAGRWLDNRLLVSLDGQWVRDEPLDLALGGEYGHRLFRDAVGVARAGYRHSATDVSGGSGLSVGVGLSLPRWTVDITWAPMGDVGDALRYGLRVVF